MVVIVNAAGIVYVVVDVSVGVMVDVAVTVIVTVIVDVVVIMMIVVVIYRVEEVRDRRERGFCGGYGGRMRSKRIA